MILKNFVHRGKASVIVGGQFGSEAKGLAAAMVAKACPIENPIATTNAGAQAGHTTVLPDGRKFVCYHLPTVGVMLPESTIYINAGSIIDPDMLQHEITKVSLVTGEPLPDLLNRIIIHPNAAVVTKEDRDEEASSSRGTTRIASTRKGVGSALARKIMRSRLATVTDHPGKLSGFKLRALNLNYEMEHNYRAVTVEIPQGTGLSMNNGPFYPYCTSRDCWVGQGLTDAGIHPLHLGRVLMVQRTYPIRVGHIYDYEGKQIGDSGPFYPDSRELEWAKDLPGIDPEITTVTKRVRRIATWSCNQYMDGLQLNIPDIVLTTFVNYFQSAYELQKLMERMKDAEIDVQVYPQHIMSWGPGFGDYGESFDALKWLSDREELK